MGPACHTALSQPARGFTASRVGSVGGSDTRGFFLSFSASKRRVLGGMLKGVLRFGWRKKKVKSGWVAVAMYPLLAFGFFFSQLSLPIYICCVNQILSLL